MSRLSGKTALVTGGGRGLGATAALALAEAGAAVMLASRSSAELAASKVAITAKGGRAAAFACDVSDYAAVQNLVGSTLAEFGKIDILINNAGIIEPIAPIAEADPAAWARNIEINLVGPFHCLRAVLPKMLSAGGGTIINISSGAAHNPLEGWSSYCSGKAGLAMMTRATALEYGASGIRVFGLAPGTIDTSMQGKIRASGINPISKIPRAELRPPEEPSQAIAYLCSSEADDLVGRELTLNDNTLRARLGLPPRAA